MNPTLTSNPEALNELLTQAGAENPALLRKLELLRQFMSNGAQSDVETEGKSKHHRRTDAYIRRIRTENKMLRERSDVLAEALGACYCWGELDNCKACHGQGTPGATAPEQDAFMELVMPVLKRLELVQDSKHIPPKGNDQSKHKTSTHSKTQGDE